MDWIKELKIGDMVFQVERHKIAPDGICKWKGIVTKIEKNYIEVKHHREPTAWLEDARSEMKRNASGNIDKTYDDTWTKNYFAPDGSININRYVSFHE